MSRTGSSRTTKAETDQTDGREPTSLRSYQPASLPEFSDLVLACRHRSWQTLGFGVLASFGMLVAAWLTTSSTYQSESYVRVRQREDVVLAAQTSRSEDLAYFRAQAQLALSPQVLARALQDEDLQRVYTSPSSIEGADWLRGVIRAEAQVGAEILSISANHRSADVSYAASLAVTQAYLDEVTFRSNEDRDRRRTELENAARSAEDGLSKQWSQLNAVATELGSSDTQALSMRDQVKMQAYRDYAQQLRAAQVRRNELQVMLSDEQTRVSELKSRPPVESVTQNLSPTPEQLLPAPEIVGLQFRINDLDAKIDEIRRIAAQPNTPRLDPLLEQRQIYAAQLAELKRQREQANQPSDNTVSGHEMVKTLVTDAAKTPPANQLSQIRKKIELNDSECRFLQERMAEIDSSDPGKSKRNGVDLEVARHSVDRQSKLADEIWASLEELKIESQSQPRVELMQMADFPLHANHSRRIKAGAGAFGLGWLLVILSVGLVEHRSCLIRHGETVTAVSEHPVFGIDADKNATSGLERIAGSAAARETAARLMLLAPGRRQVPSLFVTGATHDEPHEKAALRIGLAFAAYQRRVLLIDSDVTNERLGNLLGSNSQPGLQQLASSPADAMQYVIPTSHSDLDYLPVGITEPNSTWIDPQALQGTLRRVRLHYDVMIVAGPALCSSGESLLVAAQADLIVLTAIIGQTRWSDLAKCQDRAESTNLKIAGTLLLPESFGVRNADPDIPALHIGRPASRRLAAIDDSESNHDAAQATPPTEIPNDTEASLQQSIAALQAELKRVVATTNKPQTAPTPTAPSDSVS